MIRLIIAVPFILAGIAVIISALIGNFKFGYVLNRMQIGATADTLGTMLIIIGLIVIKGFEILTVKLVIMILFLWMANPVASHFLARTEIISNENIKEECEVCDTDGNICIYHTYIYGYMRNYGNGIKKSAYFRNYFYDFQPDAVYFVAVSALAGFGCHRGRRRRRRRYRTFLYHPEKCKQT